MLARGIGVAGAKSAEEIDGGAWVWELMRDDVGPVFGESEWRAVGALVLFHLVPGGAGAVFRFESAVVDDFAGTECNHWDCALFEHDEGGKRSGQAREVADDPFVYDAALCFEFFGVGERERVCVDLLAESDGDFGGGWDLCGVVWDGVWVEANGDGGCGFETQRQDSSRGE